MEHGDESEDELLAFVCAAVNSVCALELLFLLRRVPGKEWSRDALIRELRSSPSAVAQALDHLSRSGLIVEATEGFRYQPSSPTLDDLCRQLERQYAARPASLIRAIFETPSEKLRIFANAFRLPRDPK